MKIIKAKSPSIFAFAQPWVRRQGSPIASPNMSAPPPPLPMHGITDNACAAHHCQAHDADADETYGGLLARSGIAFRAAGRKPRALLHCHCHWGFAVRMEVPGRCCGQLPARGCPIIACIKAGHRKAANGAGPGNWLALHSTLVRCWSHDVKAIGGGCVKSVTIGSLHWHKYVVPILRQHRVRAGGQGAPSNRGVFQQYLGRFRNRAVAAAGDKEQDDSSR